MVVLVNICPILEEDDIIALRQSQTKSAQLARSCMQNASSSELLLARKHEASRLGKPYKPLPESTQDASRQAVKRDHTVLADGL